MTSMHRPTNWESYTGVVIEPPLSEGIHIVSLMATVYLQHVLKVSNWIIYASIPKHDYAAIDNNSNTLYYVSSKPSVILPKLIHRFCSILPVIIIISNQ